jgi:hypothetical protein
MDNNDESSINLLVFRVVSWRKKDAAQQLVAGLKTTVTGSWRTKILLVPTW